MPVRLFLFNYLVYRLPTVIETHTVPNKLNLLALSALTVMDHGYSTGLIDLESPAHEFALLS